MKSSRGDHGSSESMGRSHDADAQSKTASRLTSSNTSDTMESLRRSLSRQTLISRIQAHDTEGLEQMFRSGQMEQMFPALSAIRGVETRNGVAHKDVFEHTILVVHNLREVLHKYGYKARQEQLYLTAILHDIGKASAKRWDERRNNWTFHNHESIGGNLARRELQRAGFSRPYTLPVRSLIINHGYPVTIMMSGGKDKAVRNFVQNAGELVEPLLIFAEADITTEDPGTRTKYLSELEELKRKVAEIRRLDQQGKAAHEQA